MKILKSQLRKAINEQVQAFFVTPPSMGMVGVRSNAKGGANQLEEDDIDKDELKFKPEPDKIIDLPNILGLRNLIKIFIKNI